MSDIEKLMKKIDRLNRLLEMYFDNTLTIVKREDLAFLVYYFGCDELEGKADQSIIEQYEQIKSRYGIE